jgi:HlyD family secretion protein
MKKIWWWVIGIIVVVGVGGFLAYRVLAARQASAAASANLQTTTVERGSIPATISTAGTVRSGQSAVINWQTSGKVGNLDVKLGDQVKADQVLAELDPNSLAPSMINARQTLIDAKKTLDDLVNSRLQQAQALQAVQNAQTALDDLKQTSATNTAQAQQAVAAAQTALKDAQTKRTAMNYAHSTDPLVVENALTNYQIAKQQYKDALKEYNKYAHLKLTDPKRANALRNLLAVEQKMRTAFATYNWYLLPPTPDEIAQADADLAVAQANLAQAQANWDNLKNGSSSASTTLAEATLADAQRAYERVKDGPNPDDIAAAQAAVDAAQVTLSQVQLTAPFAGKVSDVNILPGDLVSSGTKAFQIDNLTDLYVDLPIAEIDISNLQVGQKATLAFDAIPNKTYNGEVSEVGLVGTSTQGVVNYPVTIKITDPDASVRPGMTAAVSVVIDQHDNVLMVPNQAIQVAGNRRQVVVLFEGQQIPVPVTVGLSNETMSEVTGNQLKEGDTILVNPPAVTTNGGGRGGAIFLGGPGGGGGFGR